MHDDPIFGAKNAGRSRENFENLSLKEIASNFSRKNS